MKKFILITTSAFVLFSCTNTSNSGISSFIPNFSMPNLSLFEKKSSEQQEEFSLDESNAVTLKGLIDSQNFDTSGATHSYNDILNSDGLAKVDIFANSRVNITNVPANITKVISAPVKTDYNLSLTSGILYFKSLYQGEYVIELYNETNFVGTVQISNKLKYKYDEQTNYNMVLNDYNKGDLDALLVSSELYSKAFSSSLNQKDSIFMLIDLADNNNNLFIVNNKIKFLKDNFDLTESEKIKLLNLEVKNSTGIFTLSPHYLTYDDRNTQLNFLVLKTIRNKGISTPQAISFLENFYEDSKNAEVATLLGNIYIKNGNDEKAQYYINESKFSTGEAFKSNTSLTNSSETGKYAVGINALNNNKYADALSFFNDAASNNTGDKSTLNFYLGKTYFGMKNFNKAIESFEAISSNTPNDAEMYYYLGVAYHEIGDLNNAKEALRKSRTTAPNTTWGRKSSIYLLKL